MGRDGTGTNLCHGRMLRCWHPPRNVTLSQEVGSELLVMLKRASQPRKGQCTGLHREVRSSMQLARGAGRLGW
jgi:hypothetical protein